MGTTSLFTEGNTTEAIKAGKINISEINLGGAVDEFRASSVEIPPTSLRAKYYCKLLSMIEKKTQGMLVSEKLRLMRMALGFSPLNVDSAREIMKLVGLLERLEYEADEDPRLSVNCKKYKPGLFREVRWLLLLTTLTHLKHSETSVDAREKNEILSILDFDNDCTQIDDFWMLCLRNGCGIDTLSTLNKKVKKIMSTSASVEKFSMRIGGSFQPLRRRSPSSFLYWASCFAMDLPEIRQLLFESREWNYQVKRFIT